MILADQHGPLVVRGFPRYLTEWRQDQLADVPRTVAEHVLSEVEGVHRAEGYDSAHDAILTAREGLEAAHVHDAYDEDLLRASARSYARRCQRIPDLAEREAFARRHRIEPPAGKHLTEEGRAKRLADERWWRRRLRAAWTRASEGALRNLGLIRKGRQPYASDSAVAHRAAQREKGARFLAEHVLQNELGEELELAKVAERSLANPAIRRGELMCRVRGFEETAKAYGHVAEFITLTTPSRYHAALAKGGRNPAYARLAVREAQQWLCRQWAKARAKLKRLQVLMYGLRVAEPHHDGTPHWHLLVFARANQAETLRAVLRGIWLSDCGDESGAAEHRVKFERIDPARGSAVGYIAKYVAKSIDGAGSVAAAADDETDTPVSDSVRRIDAWASLHGIRQFQQIGGPPIGLWREARRLREPVEDADIESARLAADQGDFAAFIQRVGTVLVGRRTNMVLEKAETGELNTYGECRAARTVGLRWASAVVFTRPHDWRIERKTQGTDQTGQHRDAEGRALNETAAGGRNRPCSVSFSQSSPAGRPALGPVAITVRGDSDIQPTDEVNAWVWSQVRAKIRPRPPRAGPH